MSNEWWMTKDENGVKSDEGWKKKIQTGPKILPN